MGKVKVYRFRRYDIVSGETKKSRRWGTRKGIERICGEMLEDTAIEVDESVVGREIQGLTERDFNPNPRTGFQAEVRG